ncbi:hypothetical protein EYF80_008481 [Liparis tanakae]|uniref:Uncharacterized protein n=1 Tax=Liparis tanakae TaxID=230148 RepID=A0A4Z2ITS5_9TELE|nr:hypothetical protein EYF80_008481 [Liparis tanakae]
MQISHEGRRAGLQPHFVPTLRRRPVRDSACFQQYPKAFHNSTACSPPPPLLNFDPTGTSRVPLEARHEQEEEEADGERRTTAETQTRADHRSGSDSRASARLRSRHCFLWAGQSLCWHWEPQ